MLTRDALRSLSDFIRAEIGAERLELAIKANLPSAVGRTHHLIAADVIAGPLAGKHLWVLRGQADESESLASAEEFGIRQAAFEAGLTTPEPLWLEPSGAVLETPFMILRHAAGTADAEELQRDLSAEAGDRLAYRLGQELARLHQTTMNEAPAGLAFLSPAGADWAEQRAIAWRAQLDTIGAPQPTFEWAINWFLDHAPSVAQFALCHRDLRLGNFVADGERLVAVLDLERVGWSDPMEDLGWLCARGARLGLPDREAGGIGTRESLYDGYKDVSGAEIDDRRVRFWEIAAALRHGIDALERGHRLAGDVERGVKAALIGLHAIEAEYDLLSEIELYAAEGQG